jgi:DNA helicase-2/ATP-dependent DNA helicase PcrA
VRHLFADAHDEIERGNWLRIDRIGIRVLGKSALSAAEWVYLKLLVMGGGEKSARYVMVDEVQDYTVTQLMVLARYFPQAHFVLLGDEHQAIREGTATFDQVRQIFSATHGEAETLRASHQLPLEPRDHGALHESLAAGRTGSPRLGPARGHTASHCRGGRR